MSLSRDTNLVQPLRTAHHPSPLYPRNPQRLRKDRSKVRRMNTHNHRPGFRRVNQRSKGVEDGREGELFPDGSDADHGGVVEGGEEEEEGRGGGDGGEGGGEEGRDGAAEGEEDVGGARGGGCGFVTVLQAVTRLAVSRGVEGKSMRTL